MINRPHVLPLPYLVQRHTAHHSAQYLLREYTGTPQLVREGGVHFIATINRNPLAWIVAIIGAEYILRWLPKGTHQYSKLVKPEELHSLLAADQLEIRDEVGVQVNPFNKQMAIVPFTGVNYMLYATK